LFFLAQKKNCGGVHFGTTASMQRGGPLAALRAAWASPGEMPNNMAPHRTLNVKARNIEASLF